MATPTVDAKACAFGLWFLDVVSVLECMRQSVVLDASVCPVAD